MPDGGISADAGEEDHGNDRRPGVPSEGRQQRADLAVVVDHEHPSGAWVRHGSPRGSSSTARTFRKSASAVKGFCRKWVPASSTPWWTMALSVYPDM